MSSCRQCFGVLSLTVIVLWSVFPVAHAQQTAPRGGRPILFSEPRSDVVSSNLNAMGTMKNPLNRLDEDLKKPFDLLDPESVTEPMRARMQPQLPAPQVNSKKVRELIEKQKKQNNWIYLEPEEMDALSKQAEQLFGADQYDADGLPKKKLSPLENFWLRMQRQQSGATNEVRRADALTGEDDKNDKDDLRSFWSHRPNDNRSGEADNSAFKSSDSAPNTTIFSEVSKPRESSGFFSFVSPPVAEKSEAREARMQEFKQLLDPHPVVAGSPTRNDFFDSLSRPSPAPSMSPNNLFNSFGGAPASAPAYSSSFSSDPLRSSGLPNSFSSPSLSPAPAPTYFQRPSLPPPTLQMPRRSF